MFDAIKLTAATVWSGAMAYLLPLHGAMHALLLVFVVNIVLGIFADLVVQKKTLNAKKFLLSFIMVSVYLSIIIGIYIVGEQMDDLTQSMFVDKTLTWMFIFFYGTDVLKNLKIIFPNSKPIVYMAYFLRLEFMNKIPHLEEFLNKDKKE